MTTGKTKKKEIDWTELVEDFQCDFVCQVDLHRIKGLGVVCGGCDSFVSLISEEQAQQIENDPFNSEAIKETWL